MRPRKNKVNPRNPLWVWRMNHGLPLMDAAMKLGVSRPAAQLWENGDTMPSDDSVAKIALGMKTDPIALKKKFEATLRKRSAA